jgi:hypothetical protein
MEKPIVLYVNHKEKKRCGVYQFGYHIGQALQKSARYDFRYVECSNEEDFRGFFQIHKPAMIIYNYHEATSPWITERFTRTLNIPQIGTIHEITQERADTATNVLFDGYIAPDTTLVLSNPIIFKTGRLVLAYQNTVFQETPVPVIGSFGFGLEGKGFEKLIEKVQAEFDEAIIKLHIPYSDFMDADGAKATAIAQHCKALVHKPNIKLEITHDFLSTTELQAFLAKNTLNAFFYDEHKNRGLSSVVDFALSVGRPIALTKSLMFRHLGQCAPSIFIEDKSLREIIAQGIQPLQKYVKEFSEANLIWDYEQAVEANIDKKSTVYRASDIFSRLYRYYDRKLGKNKKKHQQQREARKRESAWLYHKEPTIEYFPVIQQLAYTPAEIQEEYNTILDNQKRETYKKAIEVIEQLNPALIKRKIPEANVQQAFVFDSVYRLAQKFTNPRILCVGSFEDTACLSLRKVGFELEENDPVLNYPLEKFITRPVRNHPEYDIIFSTSVIEHVAEDEIFIRNIANLLAKGGFMVLTCDFKEGYKVGDAKPDVDCRFYTQSDLQKRLLPNAKNCSLYGKVNWEYDKPDFFMAGYNYTFATFVMQKNG